MNFFTPNILREFGNNILSNRGVPSYNREIVLANETRSYQGAQIYDIFLSHSFLDRAIIFGLKVFLEQNNFSVYVDWVDDPVDRKNVTPANAELVRLRMRSCECLLYATSDNASQSKWMPWELGFFDGLKQKVAIVPVTQSSSFAGQEYLGLYPVMEKDFWLWKEGAIFKTLQRWIDE